MISKLVMGVGVYSTGKFCSKINGTITKEYNLWVSMLRRCYSKEYLSRNPSYQGCEVSDNFKNFQYFAEWCNNQIGFNTEGYQLDKDAVFKGNKLYSEYTCFFVPKRVNQFFINRKRGRGEYPIGVSFSKSRQKFIATASNGLGKLVNLGGYTTPLEAFLQYKKYKESLGRVLAEMYCGYIHPTIVDKLNNYEVEITD